MVTGISRLWSEIETLSTSSYLQTHQIFRILSVYLVFFWQSIRPVTEVGNYSELAVRILTWNSSEGQQCGLEQTDRLSPDTTMQNIKGKDNLVCCIKPRLVTCPLGSRDGDSLVSRAVCVPCPGCWSQCSVRHERFLAVFRWQVYARASRAWDLSVWWWLAVPAT